MKVIWIISSTLDNYTIETSYKAANKKVYYVARVRGQLLVCGQFYKSENGARKEADEDAAMI